MKQEYNKEEGKIVCKIQHLDPLSLGKIWGALHGTLGLLIGILLSVVAAVEGESAQIPFGVFAFLIIPIINAGLGFLAGILMAAGYNYFSRFLGGMEILLKVS